MTQEYLLGIDIGTQSSRAALIDLAGVVAASSSGVTFELKRALEAIEAAGNHVAEVRTTGGAQSALWSQIKADIYQKPVVTFQPNLTHKARYDYLIEMFNDMHDRMQEPYNRYSALP